MTAESRRFYSWRPHATDSLSPTGAVRPSLPSTLKSTLLRPIGLCGGLFGGLLGVGGGSVIAPLLLLTSSMRAAQVSGTTLATVLVISSVGAVTYAFLGHLDLSIAWPIAAGSIAGAVIGATAARRLSAGLMMAIFILVLPYFALKEFWPSLAAPALAPNIGTLILLGLITGTVSGLIGIGGASLVVPSLVAFFLIDHIAAQGIAISVALADSTAAVATHARHGNVNYRAASMLAPPALLAALAGALLSHQLPEPALRYLFGTFMAAIWLAMTVRWAHTFCLGRGWTLRHRGSNDSDEENSPKPPFDKGGRPISSKGGSPIPKGGFQSAGKGR